VGNDASNDLSVETKTTLDGVSTYQGPAWGTADAELRLCRFRQTFNLYKRHINTSEPWILADSFDRPDLPSQLQVGANIYTNDEPDLRVQFDHLQIEPITAESECERE